MVVGPELWGCVAVVCAGLAVVVVVDGAPLHALLEDPIVLVQPVGVDVVVVGLVVVKQQLLSHMVKHDPSVFILPVYL